jgi:tetrahydromethanopterin S-methyltransferase subunit E
MIELLINPWFAIFVGSWVLAFMFGQMSVTTSLGRLFFKRRRQRLWRWLAQAVLFGSTTAVMVFFLQQVFAIWRSL